MSEKTSIPRRPNRMAGRVPSDFTDAPPDSQIYKVVQRLIDDWGEWQDVMDRLAKDD